MSEQTLLVRGWSVPKHNETQNEDSWGVNKCAGLIAIADGVGTASYSREWAEVLVSGFVNGQLTIPENITLFQDQLVPLREQWSELVPWERLAQKGYPYDWKAKQGGFSTFLGLKIHSGMWSAFAIGDCNLFSITYDAKFRISWPASSDADFGNTPVSIRSVNFAGSTDPHSDRNVFHSLQKSESRIKSGDCIVMCTDALSAFLLANRNRSELWWTLLGLDDSLEDFARWIARLRKEGLKNDDTTAVVIEMY
jgi:serine/threonine protein phosphatase PrpC